MLVNSITRGILLLIEFDILFTIETDRFYNFRTGNINYSNALKSLRTLRIRRIDTIILYRVPDFITNVCVKT